MNKNMIKCLKCDDIIESTYRHDFKECKCECCFVDGGNDYQRIGYENINDVMIYNNETEQFEKIKVD